jgi:hypothetical protein
MAGCRENAKWKMEPQTRVCVVRLVGVDATLGDMAD